MSGEALDARIVVHRPGFVLDAELRAGPGEVVALMGPSGAGKSTLLGVVAGLVPLHEGRVALGERTLDAAPRPRTHVTPSERGVVLLGQDPRVFPHLSARDNVAFGLRAHGAAKATAGATADEWLRRVGLAGMGGRRPAQLSGGQQQRVAIARALATSPSALLLDEPFTSLDVETAADVRAILREQLSATGTTALVATHDAVDAASVADRLVVLEEGRVTQAGAVRDVLAAPASRFVASVSGLNRVVGAVSNGVWRSGGLVLGVGDAAVEGVPMPGGPADSGGSATPVVPTTVLGDPAAVAAVFAPAAVRLDRLDGARGDGAEDAASRPGEWVTTVVRLEQTPAGVRVRTSDPEVAADLSADRATGLAPGARVRLRVDPAEVRFLAG